MKTRRNRKIIGMTKKDDQIRQSEQGHERLIEGKSKKLDVAQAQNQPNPPDDAKGDFQDLLGRPENKGLDRPGEMVIAIFIKTERRKDARIIDKTPFP